MEKIIQESVFDKNKKKPGLKFNPGLAPAFEQLGLRQQRLKEIWVVKQQPQEQPQKSTNRIFYKNIFRSIIQRGTYHKSFCVFREQDAEVTKSLLVIRPCPHESGYFLNHIYFILIRVNGAGTERFRRADSLVSCGWKAFRVKRYAVLKLAGFVWKWPKKRHLFTKEKGVTSTRMVWSTNMAAVLLFLVQWYDRQTSWHVKKKQQQQLYIKARDKTNLHTAENGSPTHTQTKMPWFSEDIFELRSNA